MFYGFMQDPTQPLSEKHQRLNKLIEGNRQRYELDTPSVSQPAIAVSSNVLVQLI